MKAHITAIGRTETIVFVVVNKFKLFFEWLAALLYTSFKIADVNTYSYEDKNKKWRTLTKKISTFVDKHESYWINRKSFRVDVFYGKRKIFIIVTGSLKERLKFIKILQDMSYWQKAEIQNCLLTI